LHVCAGLFAAVILTILLPLSKIPPFIFPNESKSNSISGEFVILIPEELGSQLLAPLKGPAHCADAEMRQNIKKKECIKF